MSQRIDWSDGSFEFIDEAELTKLNFKEYKTANGPFSICKFCVGKQCDINRAKAEEVSQLIFDQYFTKDMDDEKVMLSVMSKLPYNLGADPSVEGENFSTCVVLHLLQKIDEETSVEVDDALIKEALKVFIK